jgi:butyryl-CoA dehydrogenase
VEEYPAERAYRDSRINRIFEGTNEINRLIITGWLMKRAVAGHLPLLPAIKKLMDEVMAGPGAPQERAGPLSAAHNLLANARKLALFAAGAASQKYMQGLADQQEVMGALADCIMEVYALESCILRAEKLIAAGVKRRQSRPRRPGIRAKAMQTVEFSVAQGDRRGGRRRYVEDPDGDSAPPVQARAGGHHWLGRQIARHVLAGRYSL